MALSDEVQLRYPAQVLKELTNPRSTSASSIDSTKLTQACTSLQSYFGLYAQVAYDSTKAIHVEVAVRGVVALLQSWGGASQGVQRIKWDAWKEECHAIRDTGPRARIQATSSGSLSKTAEKVGEKSPFDAAYFADIQPGMSPADDELD